MLVRASVLLMLLASASVARADIFLWRDAEGVKHYANSRELLPADVSAVVVLHELPPSASPATVAMPAPRVEEAEPPRQAQVVYDQSAIASAYAEGWQRGMDATRQIQTPPSVNVQIMGPFAGASGGGYGYGPSWFDYNSPALITTGFDNGRSRHLTLRMLMQDQFAIDREGPYLVVNRFPPQGPNMQTFLPRGLPLLPGRGFSNRVVTH